MSVWDCAMVIIRSSLLFVFLLLRFWSEFYWKQGNRRKFLFDWVKNRKFTTQRVQLLDKQMRFSVSIKDCSCQTQHNSNMRLNPSSLWESDKTNKFSILWSIKWDWWINSISSTVQLFYISQVIVTIQIQAHNNKHTRGNPIQSNHHQHDHQI